MRYNRLKVIITLISALCSLSAKGNPAEELRRFPSPARLHVPMETKFRQINSASPPDPYPKSKESLSLPFVSMNEPETDHIMQDIKEGLQYVLQTKNNWTFAVHGTGTTGCHAVLDNLVEPDDKVLVLINGQWGEVMANMLERLDAQVVRLNAALGTSFKLAEIENALRIHRPDIVAVVQGESSTSVRQSLDGIGDLCVKNGVLLVVDVVASAGMTPVFMDKNKIDAIFTSSHKGLGAVPGLAGVSLSPAAVEKVKNRRRPPRAFQTDLQMYANLWNNGIHFHSFSVALHYSLREALATIAEEGMENTFKRHEMATAQLTRGLMALGLEHFVGNPDDRMIGITAVKIPRGKDPQKLAAYIFANHNIEISTGLGPTENKVLRFATFATNADGGRVTSLLRAVKDALRSRETDI